MDELKAPGKPFVISKRAVWEAYEKVKAKKGAPGGPFKSRSTLMDVTVSDIQGVAVT